MTLETRENVRKNWADEIALNKILKSVTQASEKKALKSTDSSSSITPTKKNQQVKDHNHLSSLIDEMCRESTELYAMYSRVAYCEECCIAVAPWQAQTPTNIFGEIDGPAPSFAIDTKQHCSG